MGEFQCINVGCMKRKEREMMKKKRKLTKEQLRLKEKRDVKIKILQEKLSIAMNKFSKKHKLYQICHPSGMKTKNGVCASQSFWQNIYVCKTKCNRQCDDFRFKTYLCRDIGCTYYPICMSKSESGRIEYCKNKNLYKERKHLYSLYKKYFHLMAIYRGLKIDPGRTLKYLKQRAEKKYWRLNVGKFQIKYIEKKVKKQEVQRRVRIKASMSLKLLLKVIPKGARAKNGEVKDGILLFGKHKGQKISALLNSPEHIAYVTDYLSKNEDLPKLFRQRINSIIENLDPWSDAIESKFSGLSVQEVIDPDEEIPW